MNNKLNNYLFFISSILIFVSDEITIFIIYTFITILFLIVTNATAINKKIKIKYFINYIIMYVFQTIYVLLIDLIKHKNITNYNITDNIICICLLLLTFIIEKKYREKNYELFYVPFISDIGMITYSDFKLIYNKGKDIKNKIYNKMNVFKKDKIKKLAKDIKATNSFKYVNKYALSRNYFKEAEKSLIDNNIYLIISNTGTPASEILSIFTNKEFNHISVSFDIELKTIISYNGGENVNSSGLNKERIEYFYQKEDSSILIYSLNVGRDAKNNMIQMIRKINREGSAYNFLGIPINKSFKPNIMYCSQFVYNLLEKNNQLYFKKQGRVVKPTDFIELDYNRKLIFQEEINFEDFKNIDNKA